MRWNSLVMLVIAVICGSLGVYFANRWLESQSRQMAGQEISGSPTAQSTIVVAADNLIFGNEIKPEILKEIPWPADSLPEGAFAKIADLTEKGRRVVLTTMAPNEPILNWKITGPNERATLSALVSEGMRAVGIRVNEVAGVGGFILPGDRVDVMFIRTDTANNERPTTDIIIQNARVLAVDQVADEKASKAVIAKVVTIEVSTLDAQKVALAQSVGILSLSLRAAGSLDNKPGRRVVVDELTSSPNEYLAEFNARKAAQDALDARLKGLEGSLTVLDQRVASGVKASQDALVQRFKDLQTTFAELNKRIDTGGKGEDALRQKLAALEQNVQKTLQSAGQGDKDLRAKLGTLELSLQKAMAAAGSGDSVLKTKLAELERSLLDMRDISRKFAAPPEIKAEPVALEVTSAIDNKLTVGVTRGIKREAYEVPPDVLSR